ncbi:MAG: DNA polymerase III subunit delta [Paludibacteraceae bacterium]|nr:DNA polymerase III subunit delta [Paludibacteraceae bacterium]
MAAKSTDFQTILSDLKQQVYKPIYFLMGEEPYYIDEISNYIQNNVLSEEEREFNQVVLYGDAVTTKEVITMARRYPMMSKYMVIIVKEAQNLSDLDDLVYYLQKPMSSTILVFCHKYKKVDVRKKFLAELPKVGVLFESKKLYDNQVPTFISDYLKGKGLQIEPKATQLLTEFLGTDLSKVVNELEKLSLLKPKDNLLTADIVGANVGINKDFNNFELLNALVNKDVLKANRIVLYFEQNPKNNPLVLTITVLFNFFSNLMLYYYIKDKSPANVAKELGINVYFVRDYQTAASKYNGWKTLQIIALLRTYDAKSKGIDSAGVPDGELLKELVYMILH